MTRSAITLACALLAMCFAVTFGVTAAAASPYVVSGPVVDVSGGPDPFGACTADNLAAQLTFSTLYPNAEPEPQADINPTNPANIAGAYHEDRWDNGGDRGLVSSATHNGGLTWNKIVVPGITKCSGGIFDRASDPWVSFGPGGKLYGIWLVFDVFDNHNGILVSTSTDGGDSWSDPIPVLVDDTGGDDKQTITADPYNANNVYAVWDRFLSPPSFHASDTGRFHAKAYEQQIFFSRTTNGGASWEPARVIYNPGTQRFAIGSIINVLPNATHDLVDMFIEGATQGNKFRSSSISVIRSTDQGVTWTKSKKAIVVAPLDVNFPGPFDPDNNLPIRSGGLPSFTVDPASGRLYAVWEDDAGQPGIDEILFSQSSDGGFTWSTPVKINKTPTTIPAGDQQAFTPTIKVASDGTVGVTYYDLRNNTSAPGLTTDYLFVHCHGTCTNASNWSETHVAGPFDLEQAAFAGGYFLGDYEGLVTTGTTFGAFFDEAVSLAANNPSDVFYTTLSPAP